MQKLTLIDYLNFLDSEDLESDLSRLYFEDNIFNYERFSDQKKRELIQKKVLDKDFLEKAFSTMDEELTEILLSMYREERDDFYETSHRIASIIDSFNMGCSSLDYHNIISGIKNVSNDEDEDNEEDIVFIYLFEEVKLILQTIDWGKVRRHKEKYQDLFTCIRICMDLYGILPISDLNTIYYRYFDTKITEKNIKEMIFFYYPIVNFIPNSWMIINVLLLDNYDDLEKIAKEIIEKPLYLPEKNEFLRYDNENTFATNPYYLKFKDWLIDDQKNDENDVDAFLLFIFISTTICGRLPYEEIDFEEMNLSFKSIEDYTFFNNLLIEVYNNTRSWPNRGNTPNELMSLQSNCMNSSKKPGQNEPCPCGSGKKYKRCCGKKK